VTIDEEQVAFRWKDYAQSGEEKTMILEGEEFLRRILMHVLPKGLVRALSYGFPANRHRRKRLALRRRLLAAEFAIAPASLDFGDNPAWPPPCPVCGQGSWRAVELLTRDCGEPAAPVREDSS
jgi:hypothetical protein